MCTRLQVALVIYSDHVVMHLPLRFHRLQGRGVMFKIMAQDCKRVVLSY